MTDSTAEPPAEPLCPPGARRLYPVNLNLADRLCLVVGGGLVALRKTKSLLAAGASIRVISPEVVADLRFLAERHHIEWLPRSYEPGDLAGAFLVFAATDDRAVQELVAAEAQAEAALLNCADDPAISHFHVPAHFRRGSMLITVSTGGGSPALARMIRLQLEQLLTPEYATAVELLAGIREQVVGGDSAVANGELFRTLLRRGLVELVLAARWQDLKLLLRQELPPDIDAAALVDQCLAKGERSGG